MHMYGCVKYLCCQAECWWDQCDLLCPSHSLFWSCWFARAQTDGSPLELVQTQSITGSQLKLGHIISLKWSKWWYFQSPIFLLSSQQKLNNDRYACRNAEETESALVRHRNHSLTALSHLPRSAPLSPSLPQANFSSTIHYIVTIIR